MSVFSIFHVSEILKRLGSNQIPVIIGPTSIGKTSLALEISEKLDAEIVSIDSRQIYKNFRIGTGQPSKQELNQIKHYLIDEIPSSQIITAFKYIKMVESIITNAKKRIVIVCGSLLYLNCLIEGLINIPSSSKSLKRKIEQKVIREGKKESYKKLTEIDKIYSSKIHVNDIKKIVRAYEIIELTSMAPSKAYKEFKETFDHICNNFFIIKLISTNNSIKNNILFRINEMFKNGWIDEVINLLNNGVHINSHPMQSIGYKQIAELLRIYGNAPIENTKDLKDTILKETWNFAKKQKTWMNNFEQNYMLEVE